MITLPTAEYFSLRIPLDIGGWELQVDYTPLKQYWYHREDWPEVDLLGVRQWMGERSIEIPLGWFTERQRAWLRDEAQGHYQTICESGQIDDDCERYRDAGVI